MAEFPSLNWVAVVLSAVAAFILGWLWFGPLFGKKWQEGMEMSDAEAESGNTPKILGMAFVLNVFLATGLAAFRATNEITSLGMSAGFGVCLSVTFVAPVLAINALFGQRAMSVLAIEAAFFVAMFALMGGVQALIG